MTPHDDWIEPIVSQFDGQTKAQRRNTQRVLRKAGSRFVVVTEGPHRDGRWSFTVYWGDDRPVMVPGPGGAWVEKVPGYRGQGFRAFLHRDYIDRWSREGREFKVLDARTTQRDRPLGIPARYVETSP